jgi:hypothetical protein
MSSKDISGELRSWLISEVHLHQTDIIKVRTRVPDDQRSIHIDIVMPYGMAPLLVDGNQSLNHIILSKIDDHIRAEINQVIPSKITYKHTYTAELVSIDYGFAKPYDDSDDELLDWNPFGIRHAYDDSMTASENFDGMSNHDLIAILPFSLGSMISLSYMISLINTTVSIIISSIFLAFNMMLLTLNFPRTLRKSYVKDDINGARPLAMMEYNMDGHDYNIMTTNVGANVPKRALKHIRDTTWFNKRFGTDANANASINMDNHDTNVLSMIIDKNGHNPDDVDNVILSQARTYLEYVITHNAITDSKTIPYEQRDEYLSNLRKNKGSHTEHDYSLPHADNTVVSDTPRMTDTVSRIQALRDDLNRMGALTDTSLPESSTQRETIHKLIDNTMSALHAEQLLIDADPHDINADLDAIETKVNNLGEAIALLSQCADDDTESLSSLHDTLGKALRLYKGSTQ